jgi:hypothetical protein
MNLNPMCNNCDKTSSLDPDLSGKCQYRSFLFGEKIGEKLSVILIEIKSKE